MTKLTELRGLKVVNEDGESLGRVWEVRCSAHRIDPDPCAIAGIFCGRAGILERFGVAPRTLRRIDWSDVIRIDNAKVIVRAKRASRDE